MNTTKLIVLLGGVGAVHLVAGALFLAGGCAQEDPPMPPGIYVPKQSHETAAPAPAPAEPAGQAVFSTPMPAEPAPAPQTTPATVEPAPSPAPVAKAEPRGEKLYIVVKNDSLWLIARKNGLTIEDLAAYNGLSPKAKLRIGQKLYIPPTGKKGVRNAPPRARTKAKAKPAKKGKKTVRSVDKPAEKPVEKSAKPAAKSSARSSARSSGKQLPPDGIYTVKEYDNFSTIAKRYGIKVSTIIAANPGVDSSRLKIGQKIRLTADAPAVPKTKAASRKAKKAKAAKAAKTAAKPASAPAEAAAPAPAEDAETAAPAPVAADPAPAAEKNAEAKTPDDPEDLLNTVKQPQENAAPENKADSAPAEPQASAASQDKDRLIQGKNGKLTIVLGEDISLAKFCKKFTVSEQVIRSQNQNLPSDGQLKAGTSILLIAEDDII